MNEKVKETKQGNGLRGYTSPYNVDILNSPKPEVQLKDTESSIKNKRKKLLTELRRFKFATTLVLVFKKMEKDDKTKYNTFYSHSIAEAVINESDIDNVFKLIYTTIM